MSLKTLYSLCGCAPVDGMRRLSRTTKVGYLVWLLTSLWISAVLGDILVRITYALVRWLFHQICSICRSLIGDGQTEIRTECPDCGPNGDIQEIRRNDTQVTFYCFRSFTTWFVANPY